MSDRPDIVIVMTDEERAVPPYEIRRRPGVAAAHLDRTKMVRRPRRSASSATTPARWRAYRAGPPSSPGSTPTCTASPRPTVSARSSTTAACAGCARARSPRSATGSEPPDTTPTTTASGTSRTPICTTTTAVRWPPTTTTASSIPPPCSATSTPIRLHRTAFRVGSARNRTARGWPTAARVATR